MKGTLHKTDEGWIVIYDQILGGGIIKRNQNSLPLHPDNIPTQAEDHFWIDGKEVDFDWCVIVDHDTGKGKQYAKLIPIEFQTKPGFVEKRMNQMLEHLASEEFKNVGDEGLFPNHTDKDIWIAGFKAGYLKK